MMKTKFFLRLLTLSTLIYSLQTINTWAVTPTQEQLLQEQKKLQADQQEQEQQQQEQEVDQNQQTVEDCPSMARMNFIHCMQNNKCSTPPCGPMLSTFQTCIDNCRSNPGGSTAQTGCYGSNCKTLPIADSCSIACSNCTSKHITDLKGCTDTEK